MWSLILLTYITTKQKKKHHIIIHPITYTNTKKLRMYLFFWTCLTKVFGIPVEKVVFSLVKDAWTFRFKLAADMLKTLSSLSFLTHLPYANRLSFSWSPNVSHRRSETFTPSTTSHERSNTCKQATHTKKYIHHIHHNGYIPKYLFISLLLIICYQHLLHNLLTSMKKTLLKFKHNKLGPPHCHIWK